MAPGEETAGPALAAREMHYTNDLWFVPGTSGEATHGRDRNGALIGRAGITQVLEWVPLAGLSGIGNRFGGGEAQVRGRVAD